jgi:hypothetical protein
VRLAAAELTAGNDPFLDFVLNKVGVENLNAFVGMEWAIGGAIGGDPDGLVFVDTSLGPVDGLATARQLAPTWSVQLLVETQQSSVPEPATHALLALAVLGLIVTRRRLR